MKAKLSSHALLLTLITCPSSALAYECAMGVTASPVWVGRCVPYSFAPEDPLFSQAWAQQAVEDAFNLWSAPQCTDLRFVRTDAEGLIVIKSRDENDPPASDSVALTTELQFDVDTGAIVGGRIVVNTQNYRFEQLSIQCTEPDLFDLKVAIASETTRLIGLDHRGVEGSISDRSDLACSPEALLGEEDRNGVCAIYPVGGPVNPCIPPEQDYKEEHIYTCGISQSGGACTDDLQCPDLHRCRTGSCQLILQSRGCACSLEEMSGNRAPNGGLWAALLLLGFIRTKGPRRFLCRRA